MKLLYAMLGIALLMGCENKPNPDCPCKTKPPGYQGQQEKADQEEVSFAAPSN